MDKFLRGNLWVWGAWFALRYLLGFIFQEIEGSPMSPFGTLDQLVLRFTNYFIIGGWSPFLNFLLVVGLIIVWFAIPLIDFLRRHFFSVTRREFFQQFNDPINARERHAFRFILWEAFKKFEPNSKAPDLPLLIEKIEWPREQRADESLLEYVNSIEWPNKEGKKFWSFCEQIFAPIFDGSAPQLMDQQTFMQLVEARRSTSKFWDSWAHRIEDKLIGIKEVQEALQGNKIDIKALAIAEMNSAKMGWDRGRGKTLLFKLARHYLSFGPIPWRTRIRRRLSRWINPDED